MKIAITGGASAGHVVPALAVAGQLRDRGAELVFLGRENTIEHDYARRAGIPFRHVPSAGLRRHRSASNLLMPFTVARGIFAAYTALRREKPDALFSKGSYVSVPVGIGAALARVPVVIHESDHSLGLANKILGRLATIICLSVAAPGPTTLDAQQDPGDRAAAARGPRRRQARSTSRASWRFRRQAGAADLLREQRVPAHQHRRPDPT
ncbi:glycosyltransferase [Streptomyces sp. NPDC006638]|uniref:glycosyltransferase n=1 Tax=Streptomyces sp. NPDC006638 TaxID=3157183 RepID=UPI0033A2C013